VIVHQRIKTGFRAQNRYLRRLIRAHKIHHKCSEKEGGEAFGFLYAPRKYEARATTRSAGKPSTARPMLVVRWWLCGIGDGYRRNGVELYCRQSRQINNGYVRGTFLMERFTNNSGALRTGPARTVPGAGAWGRLWVRLRDALFPKLVYHSILREPHGGLTLLRREWDCGYDFGRFHLKIYNLDRLRITQTFHRLGYTESRKLVGIISRIELTPLPDSMKETGIVIDGVDYKLELRGLGKAYDWKLFNERTKAIEPLTDYLLTWEA
jgi:hypothetical protein